MVAIFEIVSILDVLQGSEYIAILIPTIKSNINLGNVIFSINTQSYCSLQPQVAKMITQRRAVKDFNFWFVIL